MQYRNDKNGSPISILGYGCMRFTKNGKSIDIDKAEREILSAVENGVNYFDTAYVYSGSEAALGEIVSRNNIREKIKIATKLPQYMVGSREGIEKYFNEELRRLRTDYIDYYLMHMLTDIAAWNKLTALGVKEWINEKKESGQIKNIGFSFHGNSEMFIEILNAYDWDFCQIQYNYMDETSQAGRKGLEAAEAKGIPVIIMEPLRGGNLVDLLPEKAKEIIARDEKKRSAAELAFRWLWNQSGVICVLSGMNSMEMVDENCKIASEVQVGELGEKDFELYEEIKKSINENIKVPCTGCRYCMPCPKGVDIPLAFSCYNEMFTESKKSGRFEYVRTVGGRKEDATPDSCVGCGACEKKCPQHIDIINKLKEANKSLRPFPYRAAAYFLKKFQTGGFHLR